MDDTNLVSYHITVTRLNGRDTFLNIFINFIEALKFELRIFSERNWTAQATDNRASRDKLDRRTALTKQEAS